MGPSIAWRSAPTAERLPWPAKGLVELWDLKATPRLIRSIPCHRRNRLCGGLQPRRPVPRLGRPRPRPPALGSRHGQGDPGLFGHEGFVRGLAFSPDGQWLVSASEDYSLKLWEIASGRSLADFHGHQSFASCVAFSPDGRLIASGGQDQAVKLWSATRRAPLTFTGHDGAVCGLEFLPDSQRLVSGAGNCLDPRPAQALGRDDGRSARTLLRSCPGVHAVALHRDGRHLATALIWELGPCGSGTSIPASPYGNRRRKRPGSPTWPTARTDGGSPRLAKTNGSSEER